MDVTQLAVYSLVKRFAQRQSLAFEVMKEFRPYLVGKAYRRPSREYLKATYKGYWGADNEWQYYLHGGGCALTHTVTQVIIEWDSPDLARFDPYWFTNWVKWLLSYNPQVEAAAITSSQVEDHTDSLRTFIFNSLDQLQRGGLLRDYPDRTNRYELLLTEELSER